MSNPPVIVAWRQLTETELSMIQTAAPGAVVKCVPGSKSADIEHALTPDVDVLLTGTPDISLAAASGLKWVQAENAGVDNFRGTDIWQRPVQFTSANGAHYPQMSEFILAAMLSQSYKLALAQDYQTRQVWGAGPYRPNFMPRELAGQTLGIVGYGSIGREVARLAAALGMRILATHRGAGASHAYDGFALPGTGDPAGALPAAWFTFAELNAMLAQSDVVLMLTPLTEATRHLIGVAQLAAMKPDAVLISMARGELIDQAALIDALERCAIGAAVLDVTTPEPLPAGHKLWTAPNLLITPHVAGMSRRYQQNCVRVFCENLRRYRDHAPLLNIVRRTLGY